MEYNGILPIFKEQGFTSHDVVAVVRKILSMKHVGHTGTLDPMATGVLPICLGNGTRIIEYLDLDTKVYHCRMKLGLLTDTLDVWGSILEEQAVPTISEERIREALNSFVGMVSQVPPLYSAIKVDGKRLYSYARAGEQVEIPERNIYVKEINLLGFDNDEIEFRVSCSKGTYIRSLCRDIAQALGTLGTMTFLCREETGSIKNEDCITLDELRQLSPEAIQKIIMAPEQVAVNLGEITLNQEKVFNFINGGKVGKANFRVNKEPEADRVAKIEGYKLPINEKMYSYLVYGEERLLGIGRINKEIGYLKGDKIWKFSIK